MELTIIGSASAEPNPGAASSCYLLQAGGKQIVLECGHGASAKLLRYTSYERIGSILISHMHPDHFFDLVPLKYFITFGHRAKLPLFIPPTGRAVLNGIIEALGERKTFWSSAYEIETYDPGQTLELEGVSITMATTHHYIPAWAMRFTPVDGGPTLGYTSDTSLTDKLFEFLSGSGVLLSESSVMKQAKTPEGQGHLTPIDAGRLAAETGAKQLILTHYPHYHATELIGAARSEFSGEIDLAEEGRTFTI